MRWLLFGFLLCSSPTLLAQATDCACCTDAHRQFDFWVGDWEVYVADTLSGFNEIKPLHDGCILQENYRAKGSDFTGTSYNFYNVRTQTWHQTWVDNKGSSLQLTGKLSAGSMVLRGQPFQNAQGDTLINRITWTPLAGDRVSQNWEMSKDGGNSFFTVWRGEYRRKE